MVDAAREVSLPLSYVTSLLFLISGKSVRDFDLHQFHGQFLRTWKI